MNNMSGSFDILIGDFDEDFFETGLFNAEEKIEAQVHPRAIPQKLVLELKAHIEKVRELHNKDLADGWGSNPMPGALARKYPAGSKEFKWQWLFPQKNRWKNLETGEEGRCIDCKIAWFIHIRINPYHFHISSCTMGI